jgi:multisubunit Na+/H+ antiporter MnhB subunit
MRPVVALLFVFGVFLAVMLMGDLNTQLDPFLYTYMVENFRTDTGAHNAIAAILLNYRMYDTMFEALILLTAIIGMRQFLPSPDELADSSEQKSHGIKPQ